MIIPSFPIRLRVESLVARMIENCEVLVPGFEPGSTDRESVMMDRTTPHERGRRGGASSHISMDLRRR